jgi:hypothetical protein
VCGEVGHAVARLPGPLLSCALTCLHASVSLKSWPRTGQARVPAWQAVSGLAWIVSSLPLGPGRFRGGGTGLARRRPSGRAVFPGFPAAAAFFKNTCEVTRKIDQSFNDTRADGAAQARPRRGTAHRAQNTTRCQLRASSDHGDCRDASTAAVTPPPPRQQADRVKEGDACTTRSIPPVVSGPP